MEIPKHKIQPFIEYWSKTICPKCSTVNWSYNSHSERQYDADVEGVECYSCTNKFFLGDQHLLKDLHYSELENYSVEEVLNDFVSYDKGVACPS